MRLLKDLVAVKEGDDLSRLPQAAVTSIKANIRKGAENLQQMWANALELVHKAYEVDGIQRPTPDMEAAWEQYEENLAYAVQQLSKNRGTNGDWRMSSSIFHEALQPVSKFKITVNKRGVVDILTVEAKTLEEAVRSITDGITEYDITLETTATTANLSFSKWGIKKGLTVHIVQE